MIRMLRSPGEGRLCVCVRVCVWDEKLHVRIKATTCFIKYIQKPTHSGYSIKSVLISGMGFIEQDICTWSTMVSLTQEGGTGGLHAVYSHGVFSLPGLWNMLGSL